LPDEKIPEPPPLAAADDDSDADHNKMIAKNFKGWLLIVAAEKGMVAAENCCRELLKEAAENCC